LYLCHFLIFYNKIPQHNTTKGYFGEVKRAVWNATERNRGGQNNLQKYAQGRILAVREGSDHPQVHIQKYLIIYI
jgi:hypothetical protein